MVLSAAQAVRNHVFHEVTRSLCPVCRRVIDAQVLIRNGSVFLRKYCSEHGWREALVSSDADWYLRSFKFNKPGAIPYAFSTSVEHGCPYDCGLCPEHQQHTCLALIEITSRCNLSCPTCFADAGDGYNLSVEQVERMIDRLVETEGKPEVVQVSGGEPTMHPQLLDILAAIKKRNISHMMLNTNGLRLAQDPDFAHELAYYKPSIYLQFDGISARPFLELRGRDLRAVKQQALDNLAEAGLSSVLVATIVQGLNDSEIGDILLYGLNRPDVLGISYQPATFAGRCPDLQDPLNRTTVTDILHALETQSKGRLRVSDFFPVPCPHPSCCASTYLYRDEEEITPITRLLDVERYLEFITNRTMPEISTGIREVMGKLWSMAAVPGSDKTTENLSCAACSANLSLPAGLELLKHKFFMVHIHGFMDEHTFDIKRLMKCCIHELLPDKLTAERRAGIYLVDEMLHT